MPVKTTPIDRSKYPNLSDAFWERVERNRAEAQRLRDEGYDPIAELQALFEDDPPEPRIKPFFRWYDLWIGAYVDTEHGYIYVCPVPMLGLRIRYR
jgi:hypothetical protein